MADRMELGRAEQKVPLLTPRQHVAVWGIGVIATAFLLWHLALVLTAGVPVSGLSVTLRGFFAANPLSLGAKYKAGGWSIAAWFLLMILVGVAAVFVGRWWKDRHEAKPLGFATSEQVQMSAGEERARRKAHWTRRASKAKGFNPDTAPLNEVGSLIGYEKASGEPVVLSLEDQTGVLAPTGAGKTLHLVVGQCLDAPGPLIATSTRPEILDAIVEARTAKGRVWVFDPLNIAHWPEPMVWNPTTGCENTAQATARGLAFAGGLMQDGDQNAEFFQTQAGIITARLLRAAALDGLDMDAVIGWAVDLKATAHTAVSILKRDKPTANWGTTLATAITGADDTVSSVRMTMAQRMEPFLNPVVMRQLLPQDGVDEFDPKRFVQSSDTLILLTDDQAQTNVAPLTTMLLNDVMDAAKQVAAISTTGRLDPPMRVAADEIVNVAPLPKLPGMLSDSRGIGVQWFPVFQSEAQIMGRWGERQGQAILANLNCSIILGGLQDPKALQRWSSLTGKVDMQEGTSHLDAHSNQASQRMVTSSEREIFRDSEIRQLPEGEALVITRNAAAMLVTLIPWTDREDGPEIMAAMDRVRAARIAHYRSAA